MKKILFVCETKAQVFNSIAIRQSTYRDDEADICICNKTGILDNVIELLKEEKIFNKVFTFQMPYRPKQDILSFAIKSFVNVGIIGKIKKKLNDLPTNYSKVFVSGPDLACVSIYYLLKKYNTQIQLCLYEEGIFEYYIFTYKYNTIKRLYSKFIYGSYYLDEVKEIYVYYPRAIVCKPKSVKACTIPNTFDECFTNTVNKIFSYNKEELSMMYNCKFLFVESCFDDNRGANVQYELIKMMYENVGDSLVVKLHPRSAITKYNKIGVKCMTTKQSMEIIMLNNKLDNVTFISMYSSAILNLKFMFNMTPKVIMLNDVFNILEHDKGVISLINNYRHCYPKDKLLMPKGVEEFAKFIETIKDK